MDITKQDDQPATFTLAMKKYFGLKPEQNNQGFAAELKALDAQDRLFFAEGIQAAGINIKDFNDIKARAAGVIE